MSSLSADDCAHLSVPQNARISYSPVGAPIQLNTVATYSCDEGYVISGGTERVCGSTGDWSGEEITCQCELYCAMCICIQLGPLYLAVTLRHQ